MYYSYFIKVLWVKYRRYDSYLINEGNNRISNTKSLGILYLTKIDKLKMNKLKRLIFQYQWNYSAM